jgi:hypothetical protein
VPCLPTWSVPSPARPRPRRAPPAAQLLSGLAEQNAGEVFIHKRPLQPAALEPDQQPTSVEQRMNQVGLVFQFPERHFLGDNLMQARGATWGARCQLAANPASAAPAASQRPRAPPCSPPPPAAHPVPLLPPPPRRS